jgi:glycosyltransferase involved in cell wall biosynthesis
MKLAIFPPYYPPHIGGVESYAAELDGRLVTTGHTVTVFAPALPASAPEEEILGSVHIIRYPAFEIITNYPLPKFWDRRFRRLFKKLKAQPSDIVISHTRFFLSSLLAYRFAVSKQLPLIHIEHGSSPVQHTNLVISIIAFLYDQLIGKYLLRHATQVIAISESVASFVRSLTHHTIAPIVIYRGFNWHKYESIEIDNSKWPIKDNSTPRLIYIGRLISGKGVSDFLEALTLIKGKSWQCLIIGDGPERQHLEMLAERMNISKNTRFLGALPHTETLAILKSANIFVNPSYTEGLPTTVVEAAMFGKTIIATDVGGTREISESINLIPIKNPKVLSEKILISLLKTTFPIEHIGIKEKFSSERAIEKITKTLEKAMSV